MMGSLMAVLSCRLLATQGLKRLSRKLCLTTLWTLGLPEPCSLFWTRPRSLLRRQSWLQQWKGRSLMWHQRMRLIRQETLHLRRLLLRTMKRTKTGD